jgi:hypothetical protein
MHGTESNRIRKNCEKVFLLKKDCLKCERLSTGKTRAEGSCRLMLKKSVLVSRIGETPSILINVVFAS